jgi:hypothetical protein
LTIQLAELHTQKPIILLNQSIGVPNPQGTVHQEGTFSVAFLSGVALYEFTRFNPSDTDWILITDKSQHSLKWFHNPTDLLPNPRGMVVSASLNSFDIGDEGGGVALNTVRGALEGVPGENANWIQVQCELASWGGSAFSSRCVNLRLCYHVTAYGQVSLD